MDTHIYIYIYIHIYTYIYMFIHVSRPVKKDFPASPQAHYVGPGEGLAGRLPEQCKAPPLGLYSGDVGKS